MSQQHTEIAEQKPLKVTIEFIKRVGKHSTPAEQGSTENNTDPICDDYGKGKWEHKESAISEELNSSIVDVVCESLGLGVDLDTFLEACRSNYLLASDTQPICPYCKDSPSALPNGSCKVCAMDDELDSLIMAAVNRSETLGIDSDRFLELCEEAMDAALIERDKCHSGA